MLKYPLFHQFLIHFIVWGMETCLMLSKFMFFAFFLEFVCFPSKSKPFNEYSEKCNFLPNFDDFLLKFKIFFKFSIFSLFMVKTWLSSAKTFPKHNFQQNGPYPTKVSGLDESSFFAHFWAKFFSSACKIKRL